MTPIIAVDPGSTDSAFVVWDGTTIHSFGKWPNERLVEMLRSQHAEMGDLIIEKIASYGMAVGFEIFETVYWSGRFAEAFGAQNVVRIPRLEVKLQLCRDSRAKDANIRQAIIDRFGGKEAAIGKKAAPGPLFGISGDVWAALAVALTWWDKREYRERISA